MLPEKREHPKVKSNIHPRSKHRERYDLKALVESCPDLAPFIKVNAYDDESIDFFDPKAVNMLNKALLMHHYGIGSWDIPPSYLCPPVPGRADYIHHIADLLASYNNGKTPTGKKVRGLDIGVGASCIYPIIGTKEYDWSFVGTDVDPVAIDSANKIIEANPSLKGKVQVRLQKNPKDIFRGIIRDDERFDLTICNPPFHASMEEARAGTLRKLRNLKGKKDPKPVLNFGGQSGELWCEGGEKRFVTDMIHQSKSFARYCMVFSTLISKEANLKRVYAKLEHEGALNVKTIPMGQGKKVSRVVAWTFMEPGDREKWRKKRW